MALVVGVGIPFMAALSAYGQDACRPCDDDDDDDNDDCSCNAGSGTRYRYRFQTFRPPKKSVRTPF